MKRGKKKKRQATNKTSLLVQSHTESGLSCLDISAFSCAARIGPMRDSARGFCVFFVFLIVSIVESQQRSSLCRRERREFFTWKSGIFRDAPRMPRGFQERFAFNSLWRASQRSPRRSRASSVFHSRVLLVAAIIRTGKFSQFRRFFDDFPSIKEVFPLPSRFNEVLDLEIGGKKSCCLHHKSTLVWF